MTAPAPPTLDKIGAGWLTCALGVVLADNAWLMPEFGPARFSQAKLENHTMRRLA
jgi:hypothetical protein